MVIDLPAAFLLLWLTTKEQILYINIYISYSSRNFSLYYVNTLDLFVSEERRPQNILLVWYMCVGGKCLRSQWILNNKYDLEYIHISNFNGWKSWLNIDGEKKDWWEVNHFISHLIIHSNKFTQATSPTIYTWTSILVCF